MDLRSFRRASNLGEGVGQMDTAEEATQKASRHADQLKGLVASQRATRAMEKRKQKRERRKQRLHEQHDAHELHLDGEPKANGKDLLALVASNTATAKMFSRNKQAADAAENRRRHHHHHHHRKKHANKMQFKAMMAMKGRLPKPDDDDNDGVKEAELVTMDLQGLCMDASSISDIAQRLANDRGYYNDVNFYQNDLGDAGARLMAHMVETNGNITCLNLGWNKVGDRGAKYLAKATAVHQKLKWLDLRYNAIGDDGAMALAESIKGNPALRKLDLAGNCIEDKGAVAFAEMLRSLPFRVVKIGLRTNMVGKAGLASLHETSKSSKIDTMLQQAPERHPGQFDGKAMDVLVDDPHKKREEDEWIAMALMDPLNAGKSKKKTNLNLFHHYNNDTEEVKAMHALADLNRIHAAEKKRLVDERRAAKAELAEKHAEEKEAKALEKRLAKMGKWEKEKFLEERARAKAEAEAQKAAAKDDGAAAAAAAAETGAAGAEAEAIQDEEASGGGGEELELPDIASR